MGRWLHCVLTVDVCCGADVCREQMAEAGVNGVVIADVLGDLSNDTVLTTAWVDGAWRSGLVCKLW